ncbi:MAG: hypothetical protein KTR20_14120 [Cellvibrionaceae bacterium]|nr:hypothetical protein [Cellvibrionaceae bacterium]
MTETRKTRARQTQQAQNNPPVEPEKIVLPVTLAGNPQRRALILTANKTNQDLLWLGGAENQGVPLQPGERLSLDTTETIEVIGKAGDWLYVAELIQEAS